jgi:hypothetical protein
VGLARCIKSKDFLLLDYLHKEKPVSQELTGMICRLAE